MSNTEEEIQEVLLTFRAGIDKIEEKVNNLLSKEEYQKLSLYDKVQYDIFTVYSLNTLFWLYLRTNGLDPNENDIKNELSRIKQYMIKAKEAQDRNTIRPTVDKGAAGRFIKHGIQYKDTARETIEPPAKRQKVNN
ncbi:nuclear nucleic acid-binding protein C1D-like [Agrilus planipennis]|uniref:Nuclear nucleic acid-binding protein C1D n=1 Tax=Agrilus planipennis TaxID=224129 RepID=A0A1W4X785_AGRPL|nr:nuclear nucleic acid-binding protein C1D-like [Agrilus planipennis]